MNPIPWYKSPVQISLITTIVSGLISLFPKLGAALGITSSDAGNIVTQVFGAIAVLAPIVGTIFRAKSPVQPLTLTASSAAAQVTPASQAATDIHNAEQAKK